MRALALESADERKNVITALTSVLETASSKTETDQLLHEHAEEIVDGLLKAGRGSKFGVSVRDPKGSAVSPPPELRLRDTAHLC